MNSFEATSSATGFAGENFYDPSRVKTGDVRESRVISMLLIFLFLVFYTAASGLYARNFHPADMPCNNCHLARGTIDQSNAKILVASQEQLCKSCHFNALTASHPSGFKPEEVPPIAFPLDWKGDLTCSTCHSVHTEKAGLLRVSRKGKDLCLSCH